MNNNIDSYSDWLEFVEYLKKAPRSEANILKLQNSNIAVNNDLIIHLLEAILDLIKTRIDKVLDKYDNYMMDGLNEDMFTMFILDVKKEYQYLSKICSISYIPKEITSKLYEELKKSADLVQNNLKNQTIDIDDDGIYQSIIINNPINGFYKERK